MLCVRSDLIDVPAAEATVLQLRETATLQRTLVLTNMTASSLTLKLQESADGGGTWIDIGVAFVLGAAGGGSDVAVKNLVTTNIVRLRASGGGADRDLEASLMTLYADTAHVWVSPLV